MALTVIVATLYNTKSILPLSVITLKLNVLTLFTSMFLLSQTSSKTRNGSASPIALLMSLRLNMRHTQQIFTLACAEPTTINLKHFAMLRPYSWATPHHANITHVQSTLELIWGVGLYEHSCTFLINLSRSWLWQVFSIF